MTGFEWIPPMAAAITIIAFVYNTMKNFKKEMQMKLDATNGKIVFLTGEMNRKFEMQDEKIFQLATGKTLKEAMLEAKKKMEKE